MGSSEGRRSGRGEGRDWRIIGDGVRRACDCLCLGSEGEREGMADTQDSGLESWWTRTKDSCLSPKLGR